MDPDEACRQLYRNSLAAIFAGEDGNMSRAVEHLQSADTYYEALSGWLRMGGFQPKQLRGALRAYKNAHKFLADAYAEEMERQTSDYSEDYQD